MTNKMCRIILHLVLFILSILLLWLKTATSTSVNHQLVPAAAHDMCIEKERDALLDFKAHIQNPDRLSTWTTDKEEDYECCNWEGVTCNNQTSHVTQLDLFSFGLGGKISPSLVNLSNLSYLDLSGNSFNGTIPMFIGSMTQLSYLDLSFNSLGGNISPSLLNLSYLSYLNLAWNSFNGTIPMFIGSMTKLSYLDLSYNSFSGTIPLSVGSMTKLRYFDISSNYLEGVIPMPIGSLTKLTHLYLSDNYLYGTCIPPELGNLTNLQELALGHLTKCTVENIDWLSHMSDLIHLDMDGISLNKANKWVNVILGLRKLSYLSLRGCDLSQVTHPYSSSFINYSSSSIDNLYLDDNNLNSSIYHWLLPLTSNKLRTLSLSKNMLDGKSFGNLCSLTYLDFSYNSVVSLPDFLNNWSGCTSVALQILYSSYSKLTGSLSDEIQFFSSLEQLYLDNNELNGSISEKVWELPKLQALHLSSNYLRGVISKSIGKSKLTYIDLSMCNLGPRFPKWIQSLKSLTRLNIANNRILDTIHVKFWKIWPSQLHYLNLSANNISGVVPDLVSNFHPYDDLKIDLLVNVILGLRKLSYLSLRGCDLSQVTHPYSSSFINYSSSSIDNLYLDDNNLNSSIYHWLLPLTSNKLRTLSLSKNMLDGKSFGNLCSLTYLDFSYNSVVSLPDFLNNWSGCTSVALQILYASYSQLTGSLSDEIQFFSSLEQLYLDNNELNGSISEKVWELPKLQALHLSSNYLRGVISKSIGKSKLTYIDLSMCNLGPRFPKWIQSLKSLTRLNIANNRILDTIHVKFWKIWPSQLHYLNLSANNISGVVPDLVSNFHPYDDLKIDLSSNNFYGHIPKVPYNLASLDLSRNKFYGGISFICHISYGLLRYLDLSHNSFTGKLPDCLWHFVGLKVLNLGSNNISGRLPASVKSLFKLEVLSLHNNNLSGEFTLSLKSCIMLKFLDLGANKFTGNVPSWIGDSLPELYVLILTSNKFLGHIPLKLCQLANLQILDLSMNNLYGTIPSCLNNLTNMVQGGVLYKQKNNRNGVSDPDGPGAHWFSFDTGPNALSWFYYVDHAMIHWQGYTQEFSTNLGFFKGIDLSRNNLTGQIPSELTDVHGLIVLNLSNNALDGKIPWKIGEMENLLSLDISRNNLSGEMPSSMSQMNLLCYLDVSCNNLSGRIPSSTQLQSFDPSRYTGNAGLCGLPLTKYCPGDKGSEAPSVVGESENYGKTTDGLRIWFYIGGATGFPIGFWIVCGTLLLNRCARHAFFHFLESLQDMIYVKAVVFIAKLKRFACK